MTATSPYAPSRRQASITSAHYNHGGHLLQNSSGIGARLKITCLTILWLLLKFWKRNVDTTRIDGGGDIKGYHSGTIIERTFNFFIGVVREISVRSIGAASIILKGTETLNQLEDNVTRVTDSFEPVHSDQIFFSNHRREKNKSVSATDIGADMIKQDLCNIQRVLHFWFGHASPDEAQKGLWMIASSSVERLSQIDAAISQNFRSLIFDLSSSSKEENNGNSLARWTENVELFGWQGKVAAIIALDQLSRHIHRYDKSHKYGHQPLPNQQRLDNLAYTVANKLREHHKNEFCTGMIPISMQIFGVMPLRHASTVRDLSTVQKSIESSSQLHDEMDRMIRRFRKATNRRMAILQDEARREGKLDVTKDVAIYDENRASNQQFSDDQILECYPFQADMSTAGDHIVVKTITAFLLKMKILDVGNARIPASKKLTKIQCNKTALSTPTNDTAPTVIVSLSGGVDSMVIASALAYIRDSQASQKEKHPENILRIVAIHIDYGNRPESGSEAQYVRKYCCELGVEFVCRKIDEVTRGITARDEYERIAREIRFDLYRKCCAEACQLEQDGNKLKEAEIGIMLGHHRGDLRENVISNAHKGCGPLDLSGMTEVSRNDGVTLYRPLLPLEKSHIFDYSHTYGVPYFKDTTPHWSTRGKLRNRLIPLLEEIYGEGSMDNLSSLAAESDEAKALVQDGILSPFMNHVKRNPMGISFQTNQWKECSLFFWKFVLRQVMHSAGLGMFSDKSVESFLDRVRAIELREGWLQCRKDFAVYLRTDGRVFVFYPKFFPFGNGQGKEKFNRNVAFLGYGLDRSIEVGPWIITSEVIHTRENEASSLLKRKAYDSMEHLMEGNIKYYLNVPILDGSLPCPLMRIEGFTKPTRPAAWKGLDLKVESTLPLLGIDEHALSKNAGCLTTQDFDEVCALVRVSVVLKNVNRIDT